MISNFRTCHMALPVSPRSCMKGEHAASLQRSITSWSHGKTPASSRRCSQCSLDHSPSAGFLDPFYILVKDMISKRKCRHQLISGHLSLAWEWKFQDEYVAVIFLSFPLEDAIWCKGLVISNFKVTINFSEQPVFCDLTIWDLFKRKTSFQY